MGFQKGVGWLLGAFCVVTRSIQEASTPFPEPCLEIKDLRIPELLALYVRMMTAVKRPSER